MNNSSGPDIQRFTSGGPWEDVIGYSRVVRAGDLVMTAGCTATKDVDGNPITDPYGQAYAAFGVAVAALAQAGCDISQTVQSRMYVVDRAHGDEIGRAHVAYFGDVRPAATMVVVAGLIAPEILIEVELTGWVGSADSGD